MQTANGAAHGSASWSPEPASGEEPLVAGTPRDGAESETETEYVPCIIQYITLIARLCGVITLTILWSLTILTLHDLRRYNPYAPWYMLAMCFLLTFFELNWLFNKCVTCRVGMKEGKDESMSLTYSEVDITRKDNCCCRCWRFIVWCDNWRKSLLYIVFAVPMFIRHLVTVYTVICGLFILILAAFYCIKSFKDSRCVARRPKKHSSAQTQSVRAHRPEEQVPPGGGPGEYPPSSAQGYNSLGHTTNNVQPPGYSEVKGGEHRSGSPRTDSVPNETTPSSANPADSSPTSPSASDHKDATGATPDDKDIHHGEKSSPKPAALSTDEGGGFKLFGLLKKEERPREPVVTMMSSERGEEEDWEQYPGEEGEHYPGDKNPFEEDCEWDPNNRGQQS